MNIIIHLRKVCNHPELFKHNEGQSSVYFAAIAHSLLPPPFGEMDYILHTYIHMYMSIFSQLTQYRFISHGSSIEV